MKTKVKNLGLALAFAVAITTGVNAVELENNTSLAPAPTSELESGMTDWTLFDANKHVSSGGTVVDIAVGNPDFSILVEAVTKAELAGALSADGPFTVFAPNNDAFNDLFKELGVSGVEELTKEQLTPILTYHVVSGKVMSSDLSNTSVATLNGGKIKVDLSEGVKINESNVIAADISGNNGVIHVIDKVLIPEAKTTSSSGCSN